MAIDFSRLINVAVKGWLGDKRIYLLWFAIFALGVVLFVSMLGLGALYNINVLAPNTQACEFCALEAHNMLEPIGVSGNLGLIAVTLLVMVLVGIVAYFVQILVFVRTLELKGFKLKALDFGVFVRFICLNILLFFAVVTSWFHEKLRLVFFGLVFVTLAAIVLGFFNQLLFLLLIPIMFLWLLYLIGVYYCAIRLSFSGAVFLHKNNGLVASMKESWALTDGKVIDVFVALLILGIVELFFYFVFAIPSVAMRMGFEQFGAVSIGIALSLIISYALMPVISIISFMGLSEIYSQVLEKK